MSFEIKGLYAITDTANLSSELMLTRTEEILRAGAKLLQYRNKQANENTRIAEAEQLLGLPTEAVKPEDRGQESEVR